MKNETLEYYQNGYNCSQCLLKAADEKYNLKLSPQVYKSCSAINTGFGVGSICSVLIAGIMLFDIIFDKADAKRQAWSWTRVAIAATPSGPCQTAYIAATTASSTWDVQIFDVAFSRRMCCSRVCNASRNAAVPDGSTDCPTMRPGS